jgi:hypothetical protein
LQKQPAAAAAAAAAAVTHQVECACSIALNQLVDKQLLSSWWRENDVNHLLNFTILKCDLHTSRLLLFTCHFMVVLTGHFTFPHISHISH